MTTSGDNAKPPTLLVVDDDPAVLALVDRFASELGFDVVRESNGAAALASLPLTKPMARLSTWVLPTSTA